MIQAGDTIGPYTLMRTLGRGAFGEVWLAERRSSLITTQVALKLPLDASADLDVIRNEAQIWLKASGHPNIVPVIDAEVYDGQVVIASEYVSGGSLQDWLARHAGKAPSVEGAVSMMRGILAGLEHLHQNQLIHRDLKPDNVLLQSSVPRLTDFGLTRVLRPSGHTTNLAGTPAYMAPEAFKGHYSSASDIWAAGMLLHELLVGLLPYPQTDFYSLLVAITSDEPVVISEQVPDDLRPILTMALAKPTGDRFASAAEMAEALTPSASSRVVLSRSVTAVRPNNLPVQLTSFIGREKEIGEIRGLLSTTHLLTLTGSGGCGKTRLSLQVGVAALESYPDGVWFVELAPLSDPDLVVQTVAQPAGVKEEANKPLLDTLCEFWKTKKLLLVLDNCEHLLPACAQLADALLHSCPNIDILASSREALGIAGERTYRVPSLSLPARTERATAENLSQYEAVRLFIERAQFHQPAFTVTNRNAPALASVCHHLDGIPLALELAAARMRSLSVEEIEARLGQRFRLLTGGSRTALPRQQTLLAAVDWSYDLLTEPEKALLIRLSVFAGGWTLRASEAVCSGVGIDEWDTLDLLTSLVDKSLALYEDREGHGRYRLLETVRQYAAGKLESDAGTELHRRKHRDFYLALAQEAEPNLIGADQTQWLDRLDLEHDNLRSALEWCRDSEHQAEVGLWFAAALWRFWSTRGYLVEGRSRLAEMLSQEGAGGETRERADALNGAGNLAQSQGDYAAAGSLHEESLAISRKLGDRHGIARSLGNLGNTALEQGDNTGARLLQEESLAIRRELGDKWGIALALGNLANVAQAQGDYTTARSLGEESLALRRELGDNWGIGLALGNLGVLACWQNDYDAARSLQRESLALRRELGDRCGIAEALDSLASIALARQQPVRALQLWSAAETLRGEIGIPVSLVLKKDYEIQLVAARKSVQEDQFDEAWSLGRKMTLDEAINYALEV